MRVAIGISEAKDQLQAIQDAARKARLNLAGSKIDLAILFTSVDFSQPNLLKALENLLGSIPLIGCSSFGVITGQGILKCGLAILLISLPEGAYLNTAGVNQISTKSASGAGEELGEKLLYGFKNIRRDFAILLSDELLRDGSGLLWGLEEKIGKSFPIIGGTASGAPNLKKTSIYFGQDPESNAACGAIWGGRLNFGLGVKHGWKPLGKPRYVTQSSGNIVYKIDDQPAIRIYEEYFASDINKLRKELKRISILYPIGIHISEEEEYLLRNIISIEDDGAVVFQGNVPEKSPVRLMIGTKESCLKATQEALAEAKQGLRGKPCNFVLVFDAISRYILLGREAHKEIEIIQEGLGQETPIIGIYTYGEAAPLKTIGYQGRPYFHNQTISILAVGGEL